MNESISTREKVPAHILIRNHNFDRRPRCLPDRMECECGLVLTAGSDHGWIYVSGPTTCPLDAVYRGVSDEGPSTKSKIIQVCVGITIGVVFVLVLLSHGFIGP